MKTQQEIVEKLYTLVKENPDTKISVWVNGDTFNGEDGECSIGKFIDVELCDTYTPGDFTFCDGEIEDELRTQLEESPESVNMDEKQFEKCLSREYSSRQSSGEIEKQIIVWVK